MRSNMRIVVLSVLLGIGATAFMGCRSGSTGLDAVAVSATFEDAQAITLVIVGGATWGDALLDFSDVDGVQRQVPVALGGPSFGLVMDVHVSEPDLLFDGSTTAELRIPEGGVPVDDLFGLYDGGGFSVALGLGYCELGIDNEAGVSLVFAGVCGGLGLAREESWISLSVDGEVTEVEPQQ